MKAALDGCRLISPDSVGRQSDGDPGAASALLEPSPSGVAMHRFRVDSDVGGAVAAGRHRPPDELAEMLRRGRQPASVLERRAADLPG